MPAVAPYIPPKDAQLDPWLINFSALITATPAMFGLMASDAVTIATAVAAWHSAYLLTTSKMTKTANTVSAKNTQRVTCLAIIRPYAQQVSNNPGVTSANKIALGLNPKTSTPSPITPPASNPVLGILSQNPGILNLTYRDSLTSPTSKAKPYGAKSCQLYGKVSATIITDPAMLNQIATMTKSPFQLAFPGGTPVGSMWYLAAVWMTQKGDQSPWSPIITAVQT